MNLMVTLFILGLVVTAFSADWPSKIFAPYMYIGADDHFQITQCDDACGQKFYNIAFIIAGDHKNPAWDGRFSMETNLYADQISAIRKRGGDVIVSFGGGGGTELAIVEPDAAALEAKYQSVIDRYKLTWLDFVIEGDALSKSDVNQRRNAVLAKLQAKNPGLIISYTLPVDPDGILDNAQQLLVDAKAKGVKVHSANVTAWTGDYFHWLTTSKIGLGEDAASNNHGTFYDVQAVSLALFLGKTDFAREKLLAAREKRFARQIEPDGKMPRELPRTLSFHYSLFNLRAEMQLAALGRSVGVDLWHYQTTDGRSILKAVEFMAQFADPGRAWPYQQIQKPNRNELGELLLRVAAEFPESKIKDALDFFRPEDFTGSAERLYLKMARLPAALPKTSFEMAMIDHDRILKLADQALTLKPPAITGQVATNSAGGLHDFYSQADYAWPNPTNRTGLPYVTRDGESNPDTFTYHRMAMRQMKDAVAALAAAYALTGDDKYVPKAAELLRVFFLDAKTRMNPNLQYAQAVLGSSTGREYGIIDTLHLVELPLAVRFLKQSPAFPPEADQGLKKWFADYTQWILTSTNGVKEMNNANNHSIACYLQLASFAKFTGDERLLESCRERFREVLFPRQMTNDGSFPRELARTKPYGYSIFQADNLATLCVLLSTTNGDFWKITLPDGRTPRNAVDFIYPYLADKNQWLADGHRKDVMHWENWPARQPCLIFAYAEFGDEKYFDLWKKLNADPTDVEIRRNMAITQPLLWIASPDEVPLLKKRAKE